MSEFLFKKNHVTKIGSWMLKGLHATLYFTKKESENKRKKEIRQESGGVEVMKGHAPPAPVLLSITVFPLPLLPHTSQYSHRRQTAPSQAYSNGRQISRSFGLNNSAVLPSTQSHYRLHLPRLAPLPPRSALEITPGLGRHDSVPTEGLERPAPVDRIGPGAEGSVGEGEGERMRRAI